MATAAKRGSALSPADQFIESKSQRIRVLAGPGTGKSYGIKKRIVRRLKEKEGMKILVLTFTSVAVRDLQKDIDEIKKEKRELNISGVEVSTLHALAIRLIYGKESDVRLLSEYEEDTMLWDLEPGRGTEFRKKKEMLRRYLNQEAYDNQKEGESFESSLQEWLTQHKGVLFGQLIPEAARLLREDQNRREAVAYDEVLVDEYQDLNKAEQDFVELLTKDDGTLAVIGDDDQSIYEFRGANPNGILDFPANCGKKSLACEEIYYTECRRCPGVVVELANRLIGKNNGRKPKTFTALAGMQGGSCEVLTVLTPEEEIEALKEKIQEAVKDPLLLESLKTTETVYDKIVVLAPVRNRAKTLYTALKRQKLPVSNCFREGVFDSKAVRRHYACLCLDAQPADLVSLRILLGEEKDARCAGSYRQILDAAKATGSTLQQVLENAADVKNGDKYRKDHKIRKDNPLPDRYRRILKDMGAIKNDPVNWFRNTAPSEWKFEFQEDEEVYADTLEEVIIEKLAKEGLPGVCRELRSRLFTPGAAAMPGHIRIMTLHSAKGLSAPVVMIMSAEEELIPDRKNVKEQRRLFYVAITRCKGGTGNSFPGRLVISAYLRSKDADPKRIDTYSPSRFIAEMQSSGI